MLVNDLEQYTDAVFVGEPTGGKINHYGDSRRITLPNSGVTVRVSTLWWQGDERDKRPWKAPDIAAEPTFADYRANRDPALRSGARRSSPRRRLGEISCARRYRPRTRHAPSSVFAAWKADPRHAWIDPEPQLNQAGYRSPGGKARCPRRSRSSGSPRRPRRSRPMPSTASAKPTPPPASREAAIRSYEKALALDPKLDSARERSRSCARPERPRGRSSRLPASGPASPRCRSTPARPGRRARWP